MGDAVDGLKSGVQSVGDAIGKIPVVGNVVKGAVGAVTAAPVAVANIVQGKNVVQSLTGAAAHVVSGQNAGAAEVGAIKPVNKALNTLAPATLGISASAASFSNHAKSLNQSPFETPSFQESFSTLRDYAVVSGGAYGATKAVSAFGSTKTLLGSSILGKAAAGGGVDLNSAAQLAGVDVGGFGQDLGIDPNLGNLGEDFLGSLLGGLSTPAGTGGPTVYDPTGTTGAQPLPADSLTPNWPVLIGAAVVAVIVFKKGRR